MQRMISHDSPLPTCSAGHPARHMHDQRCIASGGGHLIECMCSHTSRHEHYDGALREWRQMHRAPTPPAAVKERQPAAVITTLNSIDAIVAAVLGAAPITAAPADTWFADQLTAMGEVIPLASTPAAPGIDLAGWKFERETGAGGYVIAISTPHGKTWIAEPGDRLHMLADAVIDASPKGGSEARDEVRIWGIEKPGSMPKLFGVRHIAELNWYPDEGYDLICMQVIERVKPTNRGAEVSDA